MVTWYSIYVTTRFVSQLRIFQCRRSNAIIAFLPVTRIFRTFLPDHSSYELAYPQLACQKVGEQRWVVVSC